MQMPRSVWMIWRVYEQTVSLTAARDSGVISQHGACLPPPFFALAISNTKESCVLEKEKGRINIQDGGNCDYIFSVMNLLWSMYLSTLF